MSTPVCSVCRIRRVEAGGLCYTHYNRRRRGEPDWDRPIGQPGEHKAGGELNSQHKLTEADVQKIRKLYAEGAGTQNDLADMFGVTQPQISVIVNRKAWT